MGERPQANSDEHEEPAERPHRSWWSRIPSAWQLATLVLISSRLPLILFAWLIHRFRPYVLREGHFLYHGGEVSGHWLVDAFQKWDSYWFLNIVRNGYQFYGIQEQVYDVHAASAETNITPFPLYPMLMRLLEPVFGSASVAGLVVSQVGLLLSLALLYQLVREDHSDRTAQWAVWAFALVPWGYAFSAIYSESLFFCLTLAAMVAVRKKRLWMAGVCGFLAATTRLPGLWIMIPLAWEVMVEAQWRLRRLGWGALWLLLVPMGTLSYFAYLWHLTGEPLAYFVAQTGWHKEFVAVWYHPLRWLQAGIDTPERWLDIGSTLFMIAILILGWRRIRRSYWVYGLITFWMLMSSSYLLGLPRYGAGLFPVYVVLGVCSERRPQLGAALLALFALSSPIVFWVWTQWAYAF